MKRLILIAAFASAPMMALAYASPGSPQGYVSDFAHVLSASDIQAINDQLRAFQTSTNDQVAVVTVPTVGADETIETYAVKLFEEWGIGAKGRDNGVLILVATEDHEARIEVGYGLEGDIPDLAANGIVKKVMIPAFKKGDYAGGIHGAVDEVTSIVSGSGDAEQYLGQSYVTISNIFSRLKVSPFAVIFFGLIIVNALVRALSKTKSWWLGGVIGAGLGTVIGFIFGFVSTGIIAIAILGALGLVFDYLISKFPPGPGKGGGMWPLFTGGGRGGFGGGGGFGGFGGGMSGGGGASGKW